MNYRLAIDVRISHRTDYMLSSPIDHSRTPFIRDDSKWLMSTVCAIIISELDERVVAHIAHSLWDTITCNKNASKVNWLSSSCEMGFSFRPWIKKLTTAVYDATASPHGNPELSVELEMDGYELGDGILWRLTNVEWDDPFEISLFIPGERIKYAVYAIRVAAGAPSGRAVNYSIRNTTEN